MADSCCPILDPTELRNQLAQIDAAIGVLMTGGRLTELRVGSNEYSRYWKYSEISIDALRAYRKDLADALAALCPEACAPLFRKNATIPLIVTKRVV
jgi:hypothetical protein